MLVYITLISVGLVQICSISGLEQEPTYGTFVSFFNVFLLELGVFGDNRYRLQLQPNLKVD